MNIFLLKEIQLFFNNADRIKINDKQKIIYYTVSNLK